MSRSIASLERSSDARVRLRPQASDPSAVPGRAASSAACRGSGGRRRPAAAAGRSR